MTSFGWKKKAGDNLSKAAAFKFQEVTKTDHVDDNEETEDEDDLKWVQVAKRRKVLVLEDAKIKSSRLKDEGSILADDERYWEAIRKWDEALELTPKDDTILEMKAQALTVLHEVFPAVQAAEEAVKSNPKWWVSYQTLARAQMGLGEVQLAIRNFSKAIHIKPDEAELWNDDLHWATSLLQEKEQRHKTKRQSKMHRQENSSSSTSTTKTSITSENQDCAAMSSNDNNSESSEDDISHRKENVRRPIASSGNCVEHDLPTSVTAGLAADIDGLQCNEGSSI